MIFRSLLIVGLGFISSIQAQCNGRSWRPDEGSGTIQSPEYPEESSRKTCEWNFDLNRKSKTEILILRVQDIQLYHSTWISRAKCSSSLEIDKYKHDCMSTKPFCWVFGVKTGCVTTVEKSANISSCIIQNGSYSGTVSVKYKSERSSIWLSRSHAKGFRLKYEYFRCPRETTTDAPTKVVTDPSTYEVSSLVQHTNSSRNFTTLSRPAATPQSNIIMLATIAAASLLVLLIVIVFVAVFCIRRRERTLTFSTVSENTQYAIKPYGQQAMRPQVEYINQRLQDVANTDENEYETVEMTSNGELNPVVSFVDAGGYQIPIRNNSPDFIYEYDN